MTSMLGLALLLASAVEVQADELRLQEDGSMLARGNVEIRWKGRLFRAEEARLDRGKNKITLAGGVNSEQSGAVLQCDEVDIHGGRMEARRIRLDLREPDGALLVRARAASAVKDGPDRRLKEVDLTICRCKVPPWTFSAAKVDVIGAKGRVELSWPVLRVRQVPVLMLPWWSLPMGRRSSGLLAPIMRYDARDGLRVGVPFYWAPRRWWDGTVTGGWIESRGPWAKAEFRATPKVGAKTELEFETMERRWLGELRHHDPAPYREWNLHGLLASDAAAVPDLAELASRRQLPAIDLLNRLRLGHNHLALSFGSWHGRRNGSLGTGPLAHGSSGALDLHVPLTNGTLHGQLGINSKPGYPLPVGIAPSAEMTATFGGVMPPWMGWQSAGWVHLGGQQRVGASVEVYSQLANARGTRLRPSIAARIQRLTTPAVPGLRSPWQGLAGELLSLGFEARQKGFLQRYGLVAGRRIAEDPGLESSDAQYRGLLLDWLGSWQRKRWSFSTRWVLDSQDLAPAVVTGSYLLRDEKGRERFRIAYQRRDLGRDLTMDLDPGLGLSRNLGAVEVGEVFEDLSSRIGWQMGHFQVEAAAAVRPTTQSLRLVSTVFSYRSPCECWGLALELGWAGDIALADQTYGAPIVGLGFSSGRQRPRVLERLREVGIKP